MIIFFVITIYVSFDFIVSVSFISRSFVNDWSPSLTFKGYSMTHRSDDPFAEIAAHLSDLRILDDNVILFRTKERYSSVRPESKTDKW